MWPGALGPAPNGTVVTSCRRLSLTAAPNPCGHLWCPHELRLTGECWQVPWAAPPSRCPDTCTSVWTPLPVPSTLGSPHIRLPDIEPEEWGSLSSTWPSWLRRAETVQTTNHICHQCHNELTTLEERIPNACPSVPSEDRLLRSTRTWIQRGASEISLICVSFAPDLWASKQHGTRVRVACCSRSTRILVGRGDLHPKLAEN